MVPLLLNGFGGGEEQPVVVIHDALTNGVRKHLPRSSSGRVTLVSDAAYAPSFLTGQGSSLALVGAYMFAAARALEQPSRRNSSVARRVRQESL